MSSESNSSSSSTFTGPARGGAGGSPEVDSLASFVSSMSIEAPESVAAVKGASIEHGPEITFSTLGTVCTCPEDRAVLCKAYTRSFRLDTKTGTVISFERLACKGCQEENAAAKAANEATAKAAGTQPKWAPPPHKPVIQKDCPFSEVSGNKIVVTLPKALFYDMKPATGATLLALVNAGDMSGVQVLLDGIRVNHEELFAKCPKSQEAFLRALTAVQPECESAKKRCVRCNVECKICDFFYTSGQWATRAGKEGADKKDVSAVLSDLNKMH